MTPLLLLHGFMDSPRVWDLVRPRLEREFDLLVPALAGHAGGTRLDEVDDNTLVDELERVLDDAGLDQVDVAGNSLGAYVALRLAARGRARTVVAFAPAGGWSDDDPAPDDALDHFVTLYDLVRAAAPNADAIVSTDEGRRRATRFTSVRYRHIPPELLAHQIRAAAACAAALPLLEHARHEGWQLDPARVTCPLRIVWGTEDALLPWPRAATRYRAWFPHADWVVVDGVGHCPQLDVPLQAAELIRGFASAGFGS